jgi:hypothetical protein
MLQTNGVMLQMQWSDPLSQKSSKTTEITEIRITNQNYLSLQNAQKQHKSELLCHMQ